MARASADIGYHTTPQMEIPHKHGNLWKFFFFLILLCKYSYYISSPENNSFYCENCNPSAKEVFYKEQFLDVVKHLC